MDFYEHYRNTSLKNVHLYATCDLCTIKKSDDDDNDNFHF